MQEMTVYGVSFDLVGKQPIVLLRTTEGRTFLPIWIGHPEAAAILMRLQGQDPPRPLTHDLTCAIIDSLDASVERVTVTELRDSTFFAQITLVLKGTEIEIDSRTSDAIAIALRTDAKIFAADDVIEESGVQFEGDEPDFAHTGSVMSLGDVDMSPALEGTPVVDFPEPSQPAVFSTWERGPNALSYDPYYVAPTPETTETKTTETTGDAAGGKGGKAQGNGSPAGAGR